MSLSVIHVHQDCLPRAWEESVIKLWYNGCQIPTQYDRDGDLKSRDCYMVIEVDNPFTEPRIHRCIPCGITELEAYRQEVVDGIHDHWVDPANGKWEYTYHERLTNYQFGIICDADPAYSEGFQVNQLDYVVDALCEAPHTRRAQATIWKPWEDTGINDPACLQRMWFRIFDDELVMCADMRSNDAFKAAFMNMYAFTDIQRVIAEKVTEKLGRTITVGKYIHMANSYHIYGSYFDEFERFLASYTNRSFSSRVWRTEDVQELITEAREQIAESLRVEKETGRKGL